ncbi:DUF305 domain-containing protein [Isoptericola sp. 4D.3]|uniref:DUF305 domain-containing protein n=1 Tax=Isoptericola peretonis TaxID=2918523 RepID=A0ABT0J6V1_9MICO|nr:DUF305 domain-containing protein [Isoptericola sp. 4D.3]
MKRTLVPALVIVAVAVLGACSNTQQPAHDMSTMSSPTAEQSPAESAPFNDADVEFAQMMIPHHQQAVEMSDLIADKSGVDPRILDLAAQIKDAQAPEIEQLTEWLEQWGAPVPESGSMDSMGSMDHGSTNGMMSADDMEALENASGSEAGRLFLSQMISHHQGAVAMAQTEVDAGENSDAVAMAERIVETQQAEISTMDELLSEK